jgi:alpha-tubulin suppressor-like RCC1 family protein
MRKAIIIIWSVLSMNILVAQSWKEIKAGSEFSLGIKSDGTLWGWGHNLNGELGVLTGNIYETSPIQIGADTNWKMVSGGGWHALAIKNDGTLWGWGFNGNGQVKGESVNIFFVPEQINSDTDWVFVETCFVSSFAIKRDGTLWGWGYNGYGILGLGEISQRTEPTQIGTAKWKSVSAGGFFTMGIQEDSTLWHWGTHLVYSEETGHTITIDSLPNQVGTDNDWIAVSVGIEHAIALKKDSSLWSHGDNTHKQLGYDTIFLNTFFQILPEEKWISIEAGTTYSFATNKEGILYGWGNNIYGQLGLNTSDYITTPTPVTNYSVSQVAAAKAILYRGRIYGLHTLILNENKDIMCVAGANYIGQLGMGYVSINKTEQFICNYTSIATNDKNREDNITVFPNPAQNYFSVTNVQNADLSLYDLLGKKISAQHSKDEQALFYTENISQGLYILKIQKGNAIISRKIQIIK